MVYFPERSGGKVMNFYRQPAAGLQLTLIYRLVFVKHNLHRALGPLDELLACIKHEPTCTLLVWRCPHFANSLALQAIIQQNCPLEAVVAATFGTTKAKLFPNNTLYFLVLFQHRLSVPTYDCNTFFTFALPGPFLLLGRGPSLPVTRSSPRAAASIATKAWPRSARGERGSV